MTGTTEKQQSSRRLRNLLLAGLVTALSSEIYFSMLVDNFRISPAVIVFPVFMVTVGKKEHVAEMSLSTMLIVFLFRFVIALGGGTAAAEAARSVFPGAFFYLTYGLTFMLLVRNRFAAPILRIAAVAAFCDCTSNCLELGIRFLLTPGGFEGGDFTKILLIAAVRGALVYAVLFVNQQYHFLLKKGEHEQRYRQLFLLTADLKSEMYLMKKNSEQIEGVMKEAYTLYEAMQKENYPKEMQNSGLNIAREVHDIKKDYYRVIQGIEEQLGKNPDTDTMQLQDLFEILSEASRTAIRQKNMNTTVYTEIAWPFETHEHYALMTILLNLVTNAAEAMEGLDRQGRINVWEEKNDDMVLIRVSDNGRGISGRRLPHIFEMGYSTKFDEVTGNIYRGVGLSSVKQLVEEQLCGSIAVESEEGGGTTFTLLLPVKKLIGD